MSHCVNRSLSLKFYYFVLFCIFVRPDWLLVRSKLAPGLTNDLPIDKNYLQACVPEKKVNFSGPKLAHLAVQKFVRFHQSRVNTTRVYGILANTSKTSSSVCA